MTRARFEFLWRHFHPSYDEAIEDPEATLDEEDENAEEDERIDIGLERVQRDQQADETKDDDNEEDENDTNEDTQQ